MLNVLNYSEKKEFMGIISNVIPCGTPFCIGYSISLVFILGSPKKVELGLARSGWRVGHMQRVSDTWVSPGCPLKGSKIPEGCFRKLGDDFEMRSA